MDRMAFLAQCLSIVYSMLCMNIGLQTCLAKTQQHAFTHILLNRLKETTANEIRENNEISVENTLIECSSIIFRSNWFNVQFNTILNGYLLTFWLEALMLFSYLPDPNVLFFIFGLNLIFSIFWNFSFFVVHCQQITRYR